MSAKLTEYPRIEVEKMYLIDLFRRIKGICWIIKTNIRSSTLSAFSMTIALVLVVIVVTGPKTAADLLLNENLKNEEFNLSGSLYPRNLKDINYTNLINLNDTVNELMDEYEISKFLNNQNRPFLNAELQFFNQTTENHTDPFLLKNISGKLAEDIENNIIDGSKVPENFNEVILLIPQNSSLNDSLGKAVHTSSKIIASFNQFQIDYWVNISFKISGIVFFEHLTSGLKDILTSSELHPSQKPIILLTSLKNAFSFVSNSFSQIDPAIRDAIISNEFPPEFEISFTYYFNFSTLTYERSKQVVTDLENFINSFASFKRTSDFSFGYSHSLGGLRSEVMYVDFVTFYYLILSIPMVLISLMLVILSFGIVNYQRNQSITQLKTRGINKTWIFFAFLGEAGILFIITFILSLIIGYPLSAVMSQSNSFFSFTEARRDLKFSVTDLWYIFLIDVGIFLLVYTKPIIDNTKLKIVE
ncbi:MAG: FtsX-like permease family protein, partial [Candidatus Hodarchaeota archaeon]